ncbi:hypothetical protein PF011_g18452 [Phytophthora fragariae]|uniref:EGF-like domain-containing protein n=1 Tax=Phytophthora fragariae TaxID=53985 RepID=A0A6A3J757_9STRA|nr:hypothetical protein PF011_g18452 [Phytophthora fragariae]
MSKRRNARRWPSLALLFLLSTFSFWATTATTTTTTLECNATAAEQEAIVRWSLLSELTFSRDSHAAAAFADRIWIVGGVSVSYYTKRLEYTTTRSDVVSSPDGIEWTEVLEEAPFRRRYGHSLITFTDSSDSVERLTLIGGFSPEPATDIWVTTDGASWTEATASTPWAGRGYHCSVVFNSKLWVLGGSPINNDVWSTSSVLKGPWKQQSGVPWSPRAAHACATHETMNATVGDSTREEFLFLMGGWRDTSLRDVWRMDSSGNWEMMTESAPWEPRAWFPVVSFDSRTNGDVQLGPRLWVLGGGIVGNGIEKMYPFSDVWYTRDGVEWIEASSNSSGISTAEWSMLTQSNEETDVDCIQKVNDVFRSSDGMLCEREGTICSGQGVCVQGGTCLCSGAKTGALCDSELPYTIVDSTSCFPESAPIVVAGGMTKRLGDVKIGDSVLALDSAGELVYSTVYYIPHESLVDGTTDFISVEHEGLAYKQEHDLVEALQITPDHLVYYLPEGDTFAANIHRSDRKTWPRESWMASLAQKPARELQVNDLLLMLPSPPSSARSCVTRNTETDLPPRNASRPSRSCPDDKHGVMARQYGPSAGPSLVRVTKLTHVSQRGAKTLYTMTGNLFVAGVLCSNFGDYYPTLPGQQLRDSVAFKLFAPHRAMFRLLPYLSTAELLRALMDQLLLPALKWLHPLLSEIMKRASYER